MSSYTHLGPSCPVLTPEGALQPFGGESAQRRLSSQAADRFAHTQAAYERRRSLRSRPIPKDSLRQRARGFFRRPRPA